MSPFLISIGILLLSGMAALIFSKFQRLSSTLGIVGNAIGSFFGIYAAATVFHAGHAFSFFRAWNIPFGSFSIEIDALSAFFLIPIFLLCSLSAIYGGEYLQNTKGKKVGVSWFFFNILTASMALVITARNGFLFLFSWEIMSLASFFLVTFEDQKKEVRSAGWTYLVATHLGTAFLFALFILLGKGSGSLDFNTFLRNDSSSVNSLLFILAVVGFGTKAGFMPFHVWLPEAHPAAPSHVSAVMSGVMIKTGIYGLVRTLTFLSVFPSWWGWVLMMIGLCSGILGILFALSQHDLKRLLAYSSVENIGIICMGLGLALLGISYNQPFLTTLGFAGALLHVLNHAFFKGLLFLGAGALLHSTKTRMIEHWGGLLKKMPWTGFAFLIGSAAICGLPPFNGFISEFFLYFGSFRNLIFSPPHMTTAALSVIFGLGLIGGLALACFTKVFGIAFLGEPRTEYAKHSHESSLVMRLPMITLALICIILGFSAPLILQILNPVIVSLTGLTLQKTGSYLSETMPAFLVLTIASGLLFTIIVLLTLIRKHLLKNRAVQKAATWDCGYIQPSPRMQYTASSFSQPLVDLFKKILGTRKKIITPEEFFPVSSSFSSDTKDVCHEKIYQPVFSFTAWLISKLRWLQQGSVHIYILYIAITLILLLFWKLSS